MCTQNQCVGSSLITMYAKCDSLEDAYRTFNEAKDQFNVVAWASMLTTFKQHGHGDKVIKLFDEIVDLEIDPNYITFVSVLSACNHNGFINQGFRYYACMVDLLGRAGLLDEATQFIDAMPIQLDSFVWGALLVACRKFRNSELSSKVAQKLFRIESHMKQPRLLTQAQNIQYPPSTGDCFTT
ncbi:hypothetical protein ZIOFF_028527 [Zingiber officinale]|uniref:Pentatricopeptide repeat-containing protein n=1 Tax=Zingiber officinale TaxID=94328 RepID=A0A8J5GS68_ZINOF|nr:hypothetical protein ZIOFF_028527 [Zingiber officinale]